MRPIVSAEDLWYRADMDPKVPMSDYGEIEELITSNDSPVGIDAKKTHIIIIHKLRQIERHLAALVGQQGQRP